MNKKNLKGMTLVEIIVAMAIFALLGVVLIHLGTNVDSTTKSANRLNKRVAIQAPYAASLDTEYSYETKDEEGNVSVVDAKLAPNLTNIEVYIDQNNDGTPDVVAVKKKDQTERVDVNSDTNVYGNRFSTKAVVDNPSGKEVYDSDAVSNSEHHLQFIDVFGIIEKKYNLNVGDTDEIKVTVKDEDGNDVETNPTNCVWTPSKDASAIASIDADGRITAIGAGECVFNGQADGGIKIVVEVVVND